MKMHKNRGGREEREFQTAGTARAKVLWPEETRTHEGQDRWDRRDETGQIGRCRPWWPSEATDRTLILNHLRQGRELTGLRGHVFRFVS